MFLTFFSSSNFISIYFVHIFLLFYWSSEISYPFSDWCGFFNSIPNSVIFVGPKRKGFWKHCWKSRNTGNQQCFLPSHNRSFHLWLIHSSQMRSVCAHLKFCSLLFPKWQNLDSSKLKEFAEDNFKFDENGRKFFQWVENTVGKGEIARYEQFLLFPQCFLKTYTAHT